MAPPPPPVPKPRLHSTKSSPCSLDRDLPGENVQLSLSRGHRLSTDAPPLSSPGGSMRNNFPTLDGITDIIAANIPSLAGVTSGIRSPAPPAPSAPPSIGSLTDSISTTIPGLAGAANAVANPTPLSPALSTPAATISDSPSLDNIISSLSHMTSLAEFVSSIPDPSAHRPPLPPEPHPPLERTVSAGSHTDVGALSQLVKASLDPTAGVRFPSAEGAGGAAEEEVQEGWVTSLLATRGLQSPIPSKLHGQVTLKDTRSRAYAAVWGHDLWIYPNKDSFQLGIASFSVPLNVATVKATGKHSFALLTPYKTFNLSVDSSKDLSLWQGSLTSTIQSAVSCSQVALRLWENPYNKVCGDCGAANPEWASVNLLLVICHSCAAQHRVLGNNLSRVCSLRMDNKAWTEPLIQLFVTYGNRLANQVWAPAVPAAEQLRPESTEEERLTFIQNKYSRGRYRRVHALTSSRSMMNQRLCQVAVSDDVEETMSLICSGAKVSSSDPQSHSPILLAEKANQALQIELLRLNEYTEVPPHQPQSANRKLDSTPAGEEDEELHGKLEDDRFFFSLENDSAACDVMDLREVLSVFLKDGSDHQFELVSLNDHLICDADDRDSLQNHLVHILKVILPGGVSYAEVGGASAVSKVCMVDVGGTSNQSDAWLLLWEDGVSIHPVKRDRQQALSFELSMLSKNDTVLHEDTITLVTTERTISLRFEEQLSCETWFQHLQRALANQDPASERPPGGNQNPARPGRYSVTDGGTKGSVPPAIQRCISHITTYGLKVEGLYRRCGLALKVKELVKALMTSPNSAPLEADEQGVLDVGSALKQFIRDHQNLIPEGELKQWQQAAVIPDERSRFKEYRRLLRQLPADNRATLNVLFGHFYMVQVFSQDNKMSAHNLAVVLAPSAFHVMTQDMIALTREFIIHHTLLFLTPDRKGEEKAEEDDEEEQITIL
ncbi:arf-GAP with Rho-GAP domain, ANK repeat and PH domain-containing protein 1 isoform 2-T2 [Anableps anableps]